MASIFVSYKAEDRRRVQPIVEALEAQGFTVWWDARIGGGDAWRATIQKELDAAQCVVVVWSKRSVGPEGRFVCDEASRAQRRGVYLPVLIDRVEPPLGFGESQAVSLVGWKGNASDERIAALVDAARAISGGRARTLGAGTGSRRLSRRTALAAGAGTAIVAAGAGSWLLLQPSRGRADSIAVLPFENLSGDPAQAYFSDGIAEELRSALARIPGLKVVARASSEAVRHDDAKTAARKLGVSKILTGSVRRSPAMIRISTELIDGRTGLESWSKTFDRPLGDTLAVQTNVAETVAEALRIELSPEERAALALGGTENMAAHDLALRAKPTTGAGDSPESMQRVVALYDAAIQLDPNYADAYAYKAVALAFYAFAYARGVSEADRIISESLAAARKAIAIAPRLRLAHAALARTLNYQLHFKEALAEIRRAVQLPGRDPLTIGYYGVVLSEFIGGGDALRRAQEAITLDPLNPGAYEWQVTVLYQARRFPDAIAAARRALAIGPQRNFSRGMLANCLLLLRRYAEAEAEYAKMSNNAQVPLAGRAAVAAAQGNIGQSDALLAELIDTFGEAARFRTAIVYAFRNETDRAIAELEKAVAARNPALVTIKVDPFLDPIRGDARFAAIVRRLNFPA